jgi:hypothetical protein
MARLIIEARGARGGAATGDRDRAVVVVSVSDEAGRAVTGLGAASFGIQAIMVAPGGPGVAISAVTSRADGFYGVELVPSTPAATWRPGQYVLAVSVGRGFDRGQGLAELIIV